ncbi:MAG: 3'(2'),5'-bisphosphate nucleotidase CysQ [Thermoplasmatota archaeon]
MATATELEQDWEAVLLPIARKAGDAILEVYDRGEVVVEAKADDSPLTQADLASHRVIRDALRAATPDIPVLSEESRAIPTAERRSWETLWIVDPLDGTKEFIKRNGEFTVNIALVTAGRTVAGIVHVPVTGTTYFGQAGRGAFKITADGERAPITTRRPEAGEPVKVVASRSHMSPETEAFVARLGPSELVSSGSSLKFCLVAEGTAHLYPRLAPTMEWDTAAAQAVLEAAGGAVLRYEDRMPLDYNREELLNPFFIATADAAWHPENPENP